MNKAMINTKLKHSRCKIRLGENMTALEVLREIANNTIYIIAGKETYKIEIVACLYSVARCHTYKLQMCDF